MIQFKGHHVKRVTSTQDRARRLAKQGALAGTYVMADVQSRGRGRLERSWSSPRGGIYATLILRPHLKPNGVSQLTYVAALAVAKGLKAFLKTTPKVKWPNDVLVNRKKIAGILTQVEMNAEVEFVLIGMGINVNRQRFPKSFLHPPTSLNLETSKDHDLKTVFNRVLKEFNLYYDLFQRKGFGAIQSEWEKYSMLTDQEVTVKDFDREIRGKYKGIDEKGGLMLETSEKKIVHVYAGDLICF
ncbi:MAG: biotin--[acetyl-CoA-carboxylase] ligase [Deltaproteobacteria bacterium]|nr:biotin--[acetyl-CoA-carboxylase] ligase [Deltaproteobacteria bacterium]